MRDFYGILGVAENAAKNDIKKAYFGMVRQYPPEKEPEKFKEYRRAYEILYNEKSREEYDAIRGIPEEYRDLFNHAGQMFEAGEVEMAIEEYRIILKQYPDLLIVNAMLAEAYSMNDNTGNAVKIWERLVKLSPDNMAYQKALGDAYAQRGFNKKALKQYEKTLELEPDNLNIYDSLIKLFVREEKYQEAEEYLQLGILCAEIHGLDNSVLLIDGVVLCIQLLDYLSLSQYLEQIAQKISAEPSRREVIANSLMLNVFCVMPRSEFTEGYAQIICFIADLLPESLEAQMIKQEFDKFSKSQEIEQDETIPEVIRHLTSLLINDCDCPDCQVEQLYLELEILNRTGEVRGALRYLREHYPDIYGLHADFYNQVLDPKKEQGLQEKLFKKFLQYQKRYPEAFQEDMDGWEYDDESRVTEPYVRSEKKISRNDPCPCGSGKKYKKCCGAQVIR